MRPLPWLVLLLLLAAQLPAPSSSESSDSGTEAASASPAAVAEWLQQIGLPAAAAAGYALRVQEEVRRRYPCPLFLPSAASDAAHCQLLTLTLPRTAAGPSQAVDSAMFSELLADVEGLPALGVTSPLHRARIVARWRERQPAAHQEEPPAAEVVSEASAVEAAAEAAAVPPAAETEPLVDEQPDPVPKLHPEEIEAGGAEEAEPAAAELPSGQEAVPQEAAVPAAAEAEVVADEQPVEVSTIDPAEATEPPAVDTEPAAAPDGPRHPAEQEEAEAAAADSSPPIAKEPRPMQSESAAPPAERVLPPSLTGVLGTSLRPPTIASDGMLTVALSGSDGVHFTSTGDGGVVVTAVRAALPAASEGLATGWRVMAVDGQPAKGIAAVVRALAAAETTGTPCAVTLAPPATISNLGEKARRKLQKRAASAAKKLRTSVGGAEGDDVTASFHKAVTELSTMGEALRLAEASADGQGKIDLGRAFTVQDPKGAGTQRVPLLAHVLSLVTRTLGLLGGVKLGLAPGTSRHRSAHLSDSGAPQAIALAKWLARRVRFTLMMMDFVPNLMDCLLKLMNCIGVQPVAAIRRRLPTCILRCGVA